MKRMVLAIGLVLLLTVSAYAHKLQPISTDSLDERNNQLGVGVDLVLFESTNQVYTIETQTKFDTQNDKGAWSNYVVAKINIWKLLKK